VTSSRTAGRDVFCPDLDDETFLRNIYRELLHREIDPDGLSGCLHRLAQGEDRFSIAFTIVASAECRDRVRSSQPPLPSRRNLVAAKPFKYNNSDELLIFTVSADADYDWLERMILENHYYEAPGPWGYDIDLDKRILAEFMSFFMPARGLEIGCGTGAVLKCLLDLGHTVEGVEISRWSVGRAWPEIRHSIHVCDLLDLPPSSKKYGLIFGMDVFEHFNPIKLGMYLDRLSSLLTPEGFVVINVPAFGDDAVFGCVHPYEVPEWHQAAADHTMFRQVPCDELGYPLKGHLVWADTRWWQALFLAHGFVREKGIELALHALFDEVMSYSEARKSYFVFSRNPGRNAYSQTVLDRIAVYDSSRISNLKQQCGRQLEGFHQSLSQPSPTYNRLLWQSVKRVMMRPLRVFFR
jgi:2-polyprenyl-3-methyl-5-hydroxy-6-metoxy-1,4-benzoquinol methylase